MQLPYLGMQRSSEACIIGVVSHLISEKSLEFLTCQVIVGALSTYF